MIKGISATLIFLWSLPLIAGADSTQHSAPHITVELRTETAHINPGQAFWAMVFFSPEPHWHTYWKNPGDSGLTPKLNWQLPAGWQADAPLFETPTAIPYGSEINYGYDGDSALLVKLTPPASLPEVPVTLKLDARWLVCADACVPGKADFALKLPSPSIDDQPTVRQRIQQARRRLPITVGQEGLYQVTDDTVEIVIPGDNIADDNLQVFIAPNHVVATQPQPSIIRKANTVHISAPRHRYFTQAPDYIEVVLRGAEKAWTYQAQFQTDTGINQREATP